MRVDYTPVFKKRLYKLKDGEAVAAIKRRVYRIEKEGHFGNYKQITNGLYELKFFIGNGYRVYYTIQNNIVVLLICGRTKDSQQSDIKKATELLKLL